MARKSRYIENQTGLSIENDEIYRAGLYARLSVEDGDNEEYNSIGNQEKLGLHFLKDKSDIRLVKIYSDNGFSGMNFKRPDFTEMMQDLRTGLINCVIVKDISRLGRHFLMTSEYVEKIFPEMGVRLICINDNFDSMKENADTSQLLLPFKMVMNDSYVRDISKKIRSSITSKMNSGEFIPPVGSIPYGYLRNPKENTFDIDPETADVIVRIYEMRSEGMKFNTIARTLDLEGVPSPGRIRFLRGVTVCPKFENAHWSRKTVRSICEDQVYIGNRVHGKVKRDKVGEEKKRRDEAEWTIIPNAHEPIISKELFDMVQMVNKRELQKEAEKKQRIEVEDDMRDVLRDKVICGDCKTKMKAGKGLPRITSNLPAFVYYNCRTYQKSRHMQCSSHYIRDEAIVYALENLLDKQINLMIDFERFVDEVSRMPKVMRYQTDLQRKQMSLQKQRKNMEEKLENLLVDLLKGTIDRDMYEYAKKQYSEKVDDLLIQENQTSVTIGELHNTLYTAQSWIQKIKKYEKLPELTKELVDELVDSIEVYSNREIVIHLKYSDPFKQLKDYIQRVPEVKRHAG